MKDKMIIQDGENRGLKCRHMIFNDHFQNYKRHGIHKAQLVIADIPYNVGKNAYGSSDND